MFKNIAPTAITKITCTEGWTRPATSGCVITVCLSSLKSARLKGRLNQANERPRKWLSPNSRSALNYPSKCWFSKFLSGLCWDAAHTSLEPIERASQWTHSTDHTLSQPAPFLALATTVIEDRVSPLEEDNRYAAVPCGQKLQTMCLWRSTLNYIAVFTQHLHLSLR